MALGLLLGLGLLTGPPVPAEAHGSHIHYASCGGYNLNNKWYSNNVRNYRFAGSLDTCGFDNAYGIVVFTLGLREIGDARSTRSVSSYSGISSWEHGNVVAISRCKYDDRHDGHAFPHLYLGCWYHRY